MAVQSSTLTMQPVRMARLGSASGEGRGGNLYTDLVGEHKDGGCFLEYDSSNGKRHYCLDACIEMGKASRSCDELAEDCMSSICSSGASASSSRGSPAPYCTLLRIAAAISFPLGISASSYMGFWPATLAALILFPATMAISHSRLSRKATPSDPNSADSPLLHWGVFGLVLSSLAWLTLSLSLLHIATLCLPAAALCGVAKCRAASKEPDLEEDAGYLHLYVRRGKHCSCCGVYRDRFDHHCLWINACIHRETHRYFVATLIIAVACAAVLPATVLPSITSSGLETALRLAYERGPFTYTMACVDLVAFFGMSAVLLLQAYGISRNRTTNEVMNSKRYFDEQMRPLPPNRGLVKNVIHFARGEWDALAPRGGDEPQEPVGARAEASSQLLRGGDASENVPQESV